MRELDLQTERKNFTNETLQGAEVEIPYEELLEQIHLSPLDRLILSHIPLVSYLTHQETIPFRFGDYPEFKGIALNSRSSKISTINTAIAEKTKRVVLNIGEDGNPEYLNILLSEYPKYRAEYHLSRPFPHWKSASSDPLAGAFSDRHGAGVVSMQIIKDRRKLRNQNR